MKKSSCMIIFSRMISKLLRTLFRAFMLALENGSSFEDSFNSSFGLSMDAAWQRFVAQIQGSRQNASN